MSTNSLRIICLLRALVLDQRGKLQKATRILFRSLRSLDKLVFTQHATSILALGLTTARLKIKIFHPLGKSGRPAGDRAMIILAQSKAVSRFAIDVQLRGNACLFVFLK